MTIVSHFFWNWYLFRNRTWVWGFACAGVLPDLPYFLLLAYYSARWRVNGFSNLAAWDLAWRSPLLVALHSFVIWAAVAVVISCAAGPRLRKALVPVWAGWLSHIVIDMLTHRSDGYPIFYPLSGYRFPTPVSYWEPAYHGREFMLLDSLLMTGLFLHFVLTRRRGGGRETGAPLESAPLPAQR